MLFCICNYCVNRKRDAFSGCELPNLFSVLHLVFIFRNRALNFIFLYFPRDNKSVFI